MAKLVWNQSAQQGYETGLDRGVLYPSNGPGVAWNGLLSVEESFAGGQNTSYYFDGIKYVDLVSPKTFEATISAFSAPPNFASAIGELSVIPGLILTRQPRSKFGFSYRTMVDDGSNYKLHIVYNATATPNSKSYVSRAATTSPTTLSWKINAVPPPSDTYRPSAHFVLDSTKVSAELLRNIESVLYGTLTRDPRLPEIDELIDRLVYFEAVIIDDDPANGLSPLVSSPSLVRISVTGSKLDSSVADLTTTKVAGIFRDLPNTRLAKTFVRGFYRLEK
jgi:hypothetical protein